MWKDTDGHTDEGRTMVNRPQYKWPGAVPDELTIEDLQDGAAVAAILDIITKWF